MEIRPQTRGDWSLNESFMTNEDEWLLELSLEFKKAFFLAGFGDL